MKKILLIFLSFINICFYAQNLYISDSNLNIRNLPREDSKIIGKIHKGDTINIKNFENNDWAVIEYQNKQSYISSKYISKIKSNSSSQLGFIEGFKLIFQYSFIVIGLIMLLLTTLPEVIKRNVNDKRYSSGRRQDKVPEVIMWKNFFISILTGIIGGIICGFFGGLIYWIF